MIDFGVTWAPHLDALTFKLCQLLSERGVACAQRTGGWRASTIRM